MRRALLLSSKTLLRVRETPCLNYLVCRRGQTTLLLFDKPGLTDGVILQFQESYHEEASVLQGRLGFRAECEVERVLDALPIGTSSKAMSTAGRTLENGIVPLGSGRHHTIHRRPAFRTPSPDLDGPLDLFNRTLRRHLIVKRGPGAGIIKVQFAAPEGFQIPHAISTARRGVGARESLSAP